MAVAPLGDQWLRRSGQARGPGFTPIPGLLPRVPSSGRCADPASSDRRQGKPCASVRSDVVGTSPSAICLAEHLVEFGVRPELPDFLRAAAGAGVLGIPLQRLLA